LTNPPVESRLVDILTEEAAMEPNGEDPDIEEYDEEEEYEEDEEYDERQVQVDRIVRWGLVFAIFWLAGIGSIIALVSGIRARRMIAASGGELVGNGRALACILAGAAGVIIWLPILLIGFLNQL
jgi:hypothetical protein